MPIIGNVEKKNIKVKILGLAIHLILIIGGATMIYPLLIMISGSLKSDVDFNDFSIAPEYVYDNRLLFQKHLLTKYNNKNNLVFSDFREPIGAITNVTVPETVSRERNGDFREFIAGVRENKPHYWRVIGMAYEVGVDTLSVRQYRAWLKKKFGTIQNMNEKCNTNYADFSVLGLPVELFASSGISTEYNTPLLKAILEFKNTLPDLQTSWIDLDGTFVTHLRTRVERNLTALNKLFGTNYIHWSDISLPERYPADKPAFAKEWLTFIRENVNLAFVNVDPAAQAEWSAYLQEKYKDFAALNKIYRTKEKSFAGIKVPVAEPAAGQIKVDWKDFVATRISPKYIRIVTLGNEYRSWLKKKYKTIAALNKAYDLGFKDFNEIVLSTEAPRDNLKQSADLSAFIDTLSTSEVGLQRIALTDYRNFVESKYRNAKGVVDYQKLSQDYHHAITNKLEIPFFTKFPSAPETAIAQNHYTEFVKDKKNAALRVVSNAAKLQDRYLKFLKDKYKTIDALNKSWGNVYVSWDMVSTPIKEYEWFNVIDNRAMLIKEYLKRNYLMVIDTILTSGHAARNTVIYCCLAVLAALMVNPLCAYALSRYKMAPSYKILLFLMLPMAFPAMVLGIPQFLLIKELGLLNTFAALILPSMANGYNIFLLKGFFDSLPKELFESAAIDGASEWVVFWHIAMGLSTPILSVIALSSFTAAYGNFMMAFLLCQDQSMWTMMVYLYQLQQRASQAVGFSALIIAAIPTLLVFIFCQNIIIKGIVVPTEK
ncbi:MAG: beta-galactosidase [Lentisphaeria bacterium]|nr:beta-galactosidase [Lentisphaeria bacterium]